jgi:glycerol kinase
MPDIILAIDEGTTNAKVVCVDKSGAIVAQASRGLTLLHPYPAWAEQDPLEIIDAVGDASVEAIASIADVRIAGIAISNQRESVVAWNRHTGLPESPVIVWQCRRSEAFCDTLKQGPHVDSIRKKSGLPIDPLFPAAKMKWLLENIENGQVRAESGEICLGTIDSWLTWHMTDGAAFVTDASNASRTQLFNIQSQAWDEQLLDIFGIPRACLARVLPSSGERGVTRGFSGIEDGLPVLSQIGDSHAALYGQGGFAGSVTKATYGTGSSLMTPLEHLESNDGQLACTIAWDDGAVRYALEGNITHAGAAVEYMAQLLGLKGASQVADLASTVSSTEDVYFVPALAGLGAPHWESRARGVVCGLTDSTNRAQLARASLESIAYQIADVFEVMEHTAGQRLERLLVDGGPTRNDWLMQFQANLLGRDVVRVRVAEVSALGAAYLAGKALGWWQTHQDLLSLHRDVDVIEPDQDCNSVQQCYSGWKKAVQKTLAGM